MSKKVAFKTLGCRLNQFETDALFTDFHAAGYELVKFHDGADVYVINTCTVTNQGDRKSRSAISQALKNKMEGSLVLVTGCMAESKRNDLESLTGVDYVVDNKRKSHIHQLIQAHENGELLAVDSLQQDVFGYPVAEKGLHTRSMVKIQDGCNNFCTFCIVPLVRGRAVSRPAYDVLENVRKILACGYREIVLTGVNISRYHHDGVDFEHLIEMILNLEGDFRIRISSLEPEGFGARFYELFAHDRLCPHLHLCLQSGSDQVLAGMKRHYTVSSFMQIIDELRTRYPRFNITTDIMVGFPGETDEDFHQTCKVADEAEFSHIHTFKYSLRKGTKAERLPGHLSERVKTERSRIIREISDANKIRHRNSMLGRNQLLLVEKIDGQGYARGYGEHYIPLRCKTDSLQQNVFLPVVLNDIVQHSSDKQMMAEPDPVGSNRD